VFGTLGALYHDEPGVSYRRTLQHPHGAEAGKLTFGQDSIVGAQLNGRANEQIEAMVQAVSRWRADNNWLPEITWGYLRLNVDDALVVRLGRVGIDAQINSESRLIGYAALAIRPTHELHASITPDYIDGMDLKFSYPLGAAIASAKAFYGITDTEINADGIASKLPRTLSRGLILAVNTESVQGRIYGGVASLRSNGATQQLVDTVRAVPVPAFQDVADALDVRGAKTTFYGADLAYDASPLSLQASIFAQTGEDNELLVPDSLATAYMAGYRLGRFTPYAQYSRLHKDGKAYTGGLGQPLDNIIQAAVDSSQQHQRTRGMGVRVDIARNVALKLQIDRVTARHSPLVTDASRPGSEDIDFTLYGLTLDFTY